MSNVGRWLLSLFGGVAIPFCYALLIAQFDAAHSDDTLSVLLRLPFAWPTYVCDLLYTPAYDPDEELHGFRGVEAYVISSVVGNVAAYTLLTYAFLSWRARARRPE